MNCELCGEITGAWRYYTPHAGCTVDDMCDVCYTKQTCKRCFKDRYYFPNIHASNCQRKQPTMCLPCGFHACQCQMRHHVCKNGNL